MKKPECKTMIIVCNYEDGSTKTLDNSTRSIELSLQGKREILEDHFQAAHILTPLFTVLDPNM